MSAYNANAVCCDSPCGTRFYLDASSGWTCYPDLATRFNDHIATILCKELSVPQEPEGLWSKPYTVCYYSLDT
jgi:hypothetical protein